MSQQILFDVPAIKQVTGTSHFEIHAEDIYPHLDFINIPILVYSAYLYEGSVRLPNQATCKKLLCKAFGITYDKSTLRKHMREIDEYILEESSHIKKDSGKTLHSGNMLAPKEFRSLILKGAVLCFGKNGVFAKNPNLLRDTLPNARIKMYFSRVARHLLNGTKDRYWYRDNAELVKKLFKYFDPYLIFRIFSATSIRNGMSGNVTKMFKALHQYFQKKKGTIWVGKRGSKTAMVSIFNGFLDAQVHALESVAKDEEFGKGDKNRSRKIREFKNAMSGVKESVVGDIWLIRTFNTDVKRLFKNRMVSSSPSPGLYDAIEWYVRRIAHLMWPAALTVVEPREVSAMLWSGCRGEVDKGKTRYTEVFEKKMGHGLFHEQYDHLRHSANGIYYEEKSASVERGKVPAQ